DTEVDTPDGAIAENELALLVNGAIGEAAGAAGLGAEGDGRGSGAAAAVAAVGEADHVVVPAVDVALVVVAIGLAIEGRRPHEFFADEYGVGGAVRDLNHGARANIGVTETRDHGAIVDAVVGAAVGGVVAHGARRGIGVAVLRVVVGHRAAH